MPLLLNRRVAFIHIPKTGGTTLEHILIEACPDDFCFINTNDFGPLRYNAESAAARTMKERADAVNCLAMPTFQHWTFDDIKRIVPDLDSWWSFAFVRSPWARLYSEHRYQTRFLKRCDVPFEDWIAQILDKARGNPAIQDNHIRPQWEFLGSTTQVFRFEEFKNGIAEVCSRLGLASTQLKEHYKSGEPDEYRSAYTNRLIDFVGRYYHEDIARFGYRYE
jgi:hypothetical protein